MLLLILGVLLLLLLANFIPLSYREGATTYKDYDESNCQTLAKQNQNNIDVLKEQINKLQKLETNVEVVNSKLDANTKQITVLAEQILNLPK